MLVTLPGTTPVTILVTILVTNLKTALGSILITLLVKMLGTTFQTFTGMKSCHKCYSPIEIENFQLKFGLKMIP